MSACFQAMRISLCAIVRRPLESERIFFIEVDNLRESETYLPSKHALFTYRVEQVGEEKQPVLVVDNFLADAEMLVDIAARLAQFDAGAKFYPGIQSLVPSFYAQALSYHLREIICETFGIESDKITHSKSRFSIVNTRPYQLHPDQSKPHVDSTDGLQLAAVHYLCPAHLGGTSLCRHRKTGFEYVNAARLLELYPIFEKENKDVTWHGKYINGSNEYYQQIASFDAKFNRLIMYRAGSLHSGNIAEDFSFDPNPRTGRLTLNTFIKYSSAC